MSKTKTTILSASLLCCLAVAWLVYATTTDFTANGGIVVPEVPGLGVTADLIIFDGSAESWSYDTSQPRYFTVTNPDPDHNFIVGSANPAARSLLVYNSSGSRVRCINNTIPGSSFVALPTNSDTFRVLPSSSLCPVRLPVGKAMPPW